MSLMSVRWKTRRIQIYYLIFTDKLSVIINFALKVFTSAVSSTTGHLRVSIVVQAKGPEYRMAKRQPGTDQVV